MPNGFLERKSIAVNIVYQSGSSLVSLMLSYKLTQAELYLVN